MSNIQMAANLRRLRTDHNYTQTQIAEMLNISRQAYSNYETGKRIPDLDMVIRLADIYHVTLEQIITQNLSGKGVINPSSGPYLIGKLRDGDDVIYLTKDEVSLIQNYRNANEDDRRLTRKILEI